MGLRPSLHSVALGVLLKSTPGLIQPNTAEGKNNRNAGKYVIAVNTFAIGQMGGMSFKADHPSPVPGKEKKKKTGGRAKKKKRKKSYNTSKVYILLKSLCSKVY